MLDYKAPIDDILFALDHGAGASRLPGWDAGLAGEILGPASRFIENEIAPLDPLADRSPPRLVGDRVVIAPELVAAVHAFVAGGWPGLAMPPGLGGQGLPGVLTTSLLEMLAGANLNFLMLVACPEAAMRLVLAQGTGEQRERFIPGLISGEYSATIVLSETQAGSDLSQIRTRAAPGAAGEWIITGNKVFTSNADHDLTPNILHCVLARVPGETGGLKELSLFFCPAVLPDGERNAIQVTRIEDKMGIHATPTCQVTFDGARAEIVGAPGEGLARMFTMMNAMRLDVAAQGVGLCQVAGQRSRSYAGERRQGRAWGKRDGAEGPVAINRHGDIRRCLLTQAALAEGGRAMLYRTAVDIELDDNRPLVDLMTPVCKVFATDAAVASADMAIQIHGGYGYIKAYRVEQILRDARIGRIFEGANGLHATNLAGRMIRLDNGASATAFENEIEMARGAADDDGREATATALAAAGRAWRGATEAALDLDDPGYVAYPYMELTGLVALGVAWSRLEGAAARAPDPERTRAIARFVMGWMLPETRFLARRVRRGFDESGIPAGAWSP